MFNPTPQDIEMLLAAQCHLGSKNLQVHMEPYLWKTRPDGVNVINIGKTWYVCVGLVVPESAVVCPQSGSPICDFRAEILTWIVV
jgi:hypothetical protein